MLQQSGLDLVIVITPVSCGQQASKDDQKDSEDKRTDMAFFMPSIHWETDLTRLQQHYIMSDVDKQVKSNTVYTDEELSRLPCSIDEKLLRKYLRHGPPMHVRRTLDQSYQGGR
ncbi:hypothetical protein NA56DRAFT_705208 [Hyaloscypha hepaticicola]|uniref:Uncharacterized protein n=1 Tax=Hyaloscypha hepaticicola TaxID=2082293 RepID=A0A2J6Q115_9HELO|nr:hypothetical protein NA56DRAFT_705208 [Hyaloscypha hepaticicola]